MELELEKRAAWSENGDPKYLVKVAEVAKCSDCGRKFEDGDFAHLSEIDGGIYHKRCDYPKKDAEHDSEKKLTTHIQLDYSLIKSEEDLQEEVREQFESQGLDADQFEEEIEKEVERRLKEIEEMKGDKK